MSEVEGTYVRYTMYTPGWWWSSPPPMSDVRRHARTRSRSLRFFSISIQYLYMYIRFIK